MILVDIDFLLRVVGREGRQVWFLGSFGSISFYLDTYLPSEPIILMIYDISIAYAQRGPVESSHRGRLPRLALRGRAGALLHAVGRLPADRGAGGRNGPRAARAPPAGRHPHGRR